MICRIIAWSDDLGHEHTVWRTLFLPENWWKRAMTGPWLQVTVFPPKRLMLCFVVCDYQPNNRQTFMNHKQKFAHWCQQRQHLHLNQVVLPDGVGGYRWVSDMVSFLQSHVDAQVTMAIKCIILLPNCWRDIGVVERVCVGRSSACDGAAQNRASRRSSTFPGGGWRSCHQCEEICLFYLMGWVHLSVENFKVDRR